MSKRVQQKQDRKAKIEAMRARQRAQERRRRLIWYGSGGAVIVALAVALGTAAPASPAPRWTAGTRTRRAAHYRLPDPVHGPFGSSSSPQTITYPP